mgnify:CR=1 FL=1
MKARTLALSLSFLIVLIACLQTPIVANAGVETPIPPPPATLLWWHWQPTNDIALSKSGGYVAVASPAGLQFYDRASADPKTPMWTYSAGGAFFSVAISADGDCVAAGNGTLGRGFVFFWKNARSLTGTPDPTWISGNLWGRIAYRALAISDDGNYLVACGTGPGVYYWADTKTKSGNDVQMTWWYIFVSINIVEAVDISSDGDYVVAGTVVDSGSGHANVPYWKNARTLNAWQNPTWMSTYPNDNIVDVAISDDGNYVAAAGMLGFSPVYYWANARSLSDDPTTTWESASGVDFSSIDMSSNGDKVIAGALGPNLGDQGVYFWTGARTRSGTQPWSWRYTTQGPVHDVAINDAGDYMAAANDEATPYVYFLDDKGDLLWRYGPLDDEAYVLSISSDGGTLAIGTGMFDSDYLVSTGYRTSRAVGGILMAVDKLTLLSPWIVVALAAVALTIFATKRRRTL